MRTERSRWGESGVTSLKFPQPIYSINQGVNGHTTRAPPGVPHTRASLEPETSGFSPTRRITTTLFGGVTSAQHPGRAESKRKRGALSAELRRVGRNSVCVCGGQWWDSAGVIAGPGSVTPGRQRRGGVTRRILLSRSPRSEARGDEEEAECGLWRRSGLGVRSCRGTRQGSGQKKGGGRRTSGPTLQGAASLGDAVEPRWVGPALARHGRAPGRGQHDRTIHVSLLAKGADEAIGPPTRARNQSYVKDAIRRGPAA